MSGPLSDPEVEREFLASILQRRRPDVYQAIQTIDPEVFSVVPYQWVWKEVRRYYAQYRLPPPRHVVALRITETFKDDQNKAQYHRPVVDLFDHRLSFDEYARDRFLDYVAARTLLSYSRAAVEGYTRSGDTGLLLRDGLAAVHRAQAVRVGLPVEDYAEGWARREEERKYRRSAGQLRDRFRFGLPGLDAQLTWSPGQLVGFLGPFKRYKSVVLNHCGFAALLQGFNVLHVTYENTLDLTMSRYDARFTGIGYDRIQGFLYFKEGEEKARADWLLRNVDGWKQRLKVVKAKPNETTVADIEAVARTLEHTEGFVPDVTIFDYGNIIKSSKDTKEERIEQAQIVWDLLAHAQDPRAQRLVVTAFQAKLEGVKVDRMDVTHFGKSIGIIQGLDVGIAINQTEEERHDDLLVFSLLVNRHGPIEQPHVETICEIGRMCVAQESDDLWNSYDTESAGSPFRFRPEPLKPVRIAP